MGGLHLWRKQICPLWLVSRVESLKYATMSKCVKLLNFTVQMRKQFDTFNQKNMFEFMVGLWNVTLLFKYWTFVFVFSPHFYLVLPDRPPGIGLLLTTMSQVVKEKKKKEEEEEKIHL